MSYKPVIVGFRKNFFDICNLFSLLKLYTDQNVDIESSTNYDKLFDFILNNRRIIWCTRINGKFNDDIERYYI